MLDKWFEAEVKPRLKGQASVIRYADDFVVAFSEEADARRVMDVLAKRFAKCGLTLHPEKTRLVPFSGPRNRSAGLLATRQGISTCSASGITGVGRSAETG